MADKISKSDETIKSKEANICTGKKHKKYRVCFVIYKGRSRTNNGPNSCLLAFYWHSEKVLKFL